MSSFLDYLLAASDASISVTAACHSGLYPMAVMRSLVVLMIMVFPSGLRCRWRGFRPLLLSWSGPPWPCVAVIRLCVRAGLDGGIGGHVGGGRPDYWDLQFDSPDLPLIRECSQVCLFGCLGRSSPWYFGNQGPPVWPRQLSRLLLYWLLVLQRRL